MLTAITSVQIAAGSIALLLAVLLISSQVRGGALSPNVLLFLEVVCCAVLVAATRRRSTVFSSVVNARANEVFPLAEPGTRQWRVFTLPQRVLRSGVQIQPPAGTIWSGHHLLSPAVFDSQDYPVADWGLCTYCSVADLQRADPDGHVVVMLGHIQPPFSADTTRGASLAASATVVRVWAKPGTPVAAGITEWASGDEVSVVSDLDELILDVPAVTGAEPLHRLPRRRFYVSSYRWAYASAEQHRRWLVAVAAIGFGFIGLATAAVLLLGWAANGAAVMGNPVLLAVGAGSALVSVLWLNLAARRIDDRYGAALLD